MRACSNLGMLDQRISDAVKARQEVDLRIGEKGGERIVRGLRRRKGVVGERCFQRKESVEREAGGGACYPTKLYLKLQVKPTVLAFCSRPGLLFLCWYQIKYTCHPPGLSSLVQAVHSPASRRCA